MILSGPDYQSILRGSFRSIVHVALLNLTRQCSLASLAFQLSTKSKCMLGYTCLVFSAPELFLHLKELAVRDQWFVNADKLVSCPSKSKKTSVEWILQYPRKTID